MREIKCRAKTTVPVDILDDYGLKHDNGWIYGVYLDEFIISGVDEANDEYIAIRNWCRVNPETVGQYTGLKDKNGVEIYEGDIIAYADDLAHRMYLESLARSVPNEYYDTVYDEQRKIGLVEYCAESGYPAFDLTGHDSEYNMLSELQIGYITENGEYWYEVIGNIYEHPELITQKEGKV